MGKGGFSSILSAVVMAVAVAASLWTGGASLAIAAGIAAGAASYIATSSMMAAVSGTQTTDSATTLSRTTAPQSGLPIVYGGQAPDFSPWDNSCYIKVGSIVPWYNVQNNSSQYLYTAHALCMGPIPQFISQLYFDDEPVLDFPIEAEGIVDSSKIKEKYRPYLQLEVYFGNSYSGTSSLATQYAGSQWNSTFHGNNIVQVHTVIKKTQDSLENSILVNDNYVLTAEIKGRLIYDLTDGVTRASSNPPSQIYDFITNTEYGMGIDPSVIDLNSFSSIAQYCQQYEYYSNGAIDYQKSNKSNIESILQSFGGVLYVHAGKMYLTIDVASSSVASFNEDTIFGELTYSTSGMTDYFNAVDATYTNVDNSYSSDVLRLPSDITQDDVINSDGRIIVTDLDFSWIYDKSKVAELANKELLKSKYLLNTLAFTTDSGWDLKPWDVITVSFSEYGLSNKKFRVLTKEIVMTQDGIGMVNLTCVEYSDGVYSGTDPGVWSVTGSISKVVSVQPPKNLSVTRKGTTNNGLTVVMDWDASIDPNLLGYYTYYRQSGSTTWLVADQTSKYVTEYELYGLNQSTQYDFAVAAYNNLGFVSDKVSQTGIVPDYNFTMPEISNLHLVNYDSNYGTTQTEQTDFIIGWNAPTGNVNGKPFSSYFKQYEIVVRDSQGTQLNSYYTTSTTWTYTYAMNQSDGLSRQRTFGVIVHGQSASDYSSEVQLTVINPQAPLIQNVQMNSAIGQIAFTYDSDNFPDDFAGVLFQVSSSADFTIGVTNYTSTQYYTYFASIADGSYYVRAAIYDLFGMDNLKWSTITPFNQQTSLQFSQLNNDVVDGILSSSEFNTVKEQIIDEAGYTGWTVSVNNNNYVSGIALANSGTESTFTVVADRFSVIDSATASSSNKVYPFVVQGGVSYINGAIIQSASIGSSAIGTAVINNAHLANSSVSTEKVQDSTITTAKIASVIQSTNYVANSTGWQINKSGNFYINGTTSGTGRMSISNNQINIYDGSGVLRVRLGLW